MLECETANGSIQWSTALDFAHIYKNPHASHFICGNIELLTNQRFKIWHLLGMLYLNKCIYGTGYIEVTTSDAHPEEVVKAECVQITFIVDVENSE
jgi:hypothetical protein